MKKILFIFCISLFLICCNSNPAEKPNDLISEDQMVDILYDLSIINAMKSSGTKFSSPDEPTAAKYIFEKYKIDSVQFSQSDLYYATDIDEYEKIYKKVTDRLLENKAAVDTLIAKTPKTPAPKKKTKTDLKPINAKDSILKKRIIKESLFKKKSEN